MFLLFRDIPEGGDQHFRPVSCYCVVVYISMELICAEMILKLKGLDVSMSKASFPLEESCTFKPAHALRGARGRLKGIDATQTGFTILSVVNASPPPISTKTVVTYGNATYRHVQIAPCFGGVVGCKGRDKNNSRKEKEEDIKK